MPYIPQKIDPSQPLLEITPGDIKIHLVPNKDHVVELKLKNLTDARVAFKVKTTAPDKYQVRPIQSTVGGGETTTCMIVLKAMTELPDANDKACKNKFLIQSVTYDDETEISQFWKLAEGTKLIDGKPTFHDQRIVCTLIPTDPATLHGTGLPSVVPSNGPSSPSNSAAVAQIKAQLDEKTKEFDGLMDFTVKQNNQIKTLTTQLQQKNEENDNLKRTVNQLEKATAPVAPVNVPAVTPPAVVNGAPMWALGVTFLIGLIFCYLFICAGGCPAKQ